MVNELFVVGGSQGRFLIEEPRRRIDFEEIFVLIDTNGGNTLYPVSLLHSKVQHRNKVMDKILVYLG